MLNKEKHQKELRWGCGDGTRYEKEINHISARASNALDYGCGKGKLKINNVSDVFRYDPCNPEFQERPPTGAEYDVIFYVDVLEHVEPEYVNNVLKDIDNFLKKEVLFVVSTRPALHTLPDGSNAHRTIKSIDWWNNKLKEHFANVNRIIVSRSKPDECVFIATKKIESTFNI